MPYRLCDKKAAQLRVGDRVTGWGPGGRMHEVTANIPSSGGQRQVDACDLLGNTRREVLPADGDVTVAERSDQ